MAACDPDVDVAYLVVDYADREEFLGDYAQTLSHGTLVLDTDRQLGPGTPVKLRIKFPGLLRSVLLDGVVEDTGGDDLPQSARVHILSQPELADLAERIEQGDPTVVARLVRVLIVEDNHHVAELISNGLAAAARRDIGHVQLSFTRVDDGGSALQLLRESTFDLAIIDVYLPVLDGPALIRQARQQLGLADLQILTLSAGGESARAQAMAAGANAFLEKPVRLRDVLATMRELVKV
jgi:CheY-like chemotaxis protein